MMASAAPLPFSTCLSTQLKHVEISPSGNQLKLGCETPEASCLVERDKDLVGV